MEMQSDYLGLHNLVAPRGARKNPKRLGRGESSGSGKTSGRGHKGQKARKSGNVRIGFEGGQKPLARRLPKRGFTSLATKDAIVNLRNLFDRFEDGALIDPASLMAAGLLSSGRARVKLLGVGEARKKYSVHVHSISESAREKIEKSGGSIEILS